MADSMYNTCEISAWMVDVSYAHNLGVGLIVVIQELLSATNES